MKCCMDLFVLTGHNDFIGQTRKPWVSIDTNKFINYLEEFGYNIEKSEFHKILNENPNISGETIFYTFHQKSEIREYIRDAMYSLNKNNNIIPSYDMLKCHENKGFQEILRKSLSIEGLNSYYFSSCEELEKYEIRFPVVLKTVDGSNGTGVFLCNSKNDILNKISKFDKQDIFTKIDLFRRKYLRKKKQYPLYPEYTNESDYRLYSDYVKHEKRFILQEFVPNLKNDYRVLIIYDKYFVMKRHNRKNDFRASGAKKFDINFVPEETLLNKAKYYYEKFDSPFLSIDLLFDERDDDYKLVEYQALHFGITSIIGNDKYFYYEDIWKDKPANNQFEYELAYGLDKYIREKKYGIL